MYLADIEEVLVCYDSPTFKVDQHFNLTVAVTILICDGYEQRAKDVLKALRTVIPNNVSGSVESWRCGTYGHAVRLLF
jgi:hypothetical protein